MLLVDLNVLCELEIIRLIQTKFKSFESAKSTETNIDSENFKIKWLNFYSRDMLEYKEKSYKMIWRGGFVARGEGDWLSELCQDLRYKSYDISSMLSMEGLNAF